MSKKMLINATHPEENRVAIVEDGILSELDIEVGGREQTKGNIYKAVVVRVEPGLQAAFVDYGAERLGFLQMGELHPAFFKVEKEGESKGRPRINDLLRRGQELLVQIVKEERGTKGAALTTYLSLPGRYMVLMPETDTKGISRKIEEEPQRKKLKEAMRSLDLPQNMGYIVRTAGIGQTPEELKRDFDYLIRVYEKIRTLSKQVKAPALVYKESNLVIRSIRDYFTSDMDEVLVDDPKVFQEAKEFFQEVMPEFARLVKLHQERRPIFSRYQIEDQIETISKNKVPLPSGGSIVIDSTEALVAVDVNSGKMAGEQGVEATAFKTNMEAAAEVGRQLRLRDLGGLIVIDFIDMRDRKHNRDVEKCLKDALKNDKARVTVGRISSQFGLLEMSRQRIKATLAEGSFLSCPHCDGSGKVKSPEAQSVAFLRKIQAGIAKGQIGRVDGEIPLDVANYLLNNKRGEIVEMERQHRLSIVVKGRPDLIAGQVELTFVRREDLEETEAERYEAVVATHSAHPEPEPAPELAEPVEEEAEAAEEETEEGGKKKRRRRRRKKKSEAAPTAAEATAGEEVPGEAAEEAVAAWPEEQPAAAEAAPEEPAVAEVAPAAGETEEVKKKRRRRRKKKPAAAVTPETAAAGEAPAATETAPAPAAPQVESQAQPDERLTAPPVPPEAPAAPAEAPAAPAERKPAVAEPAAAAAPTEEKPKPARPRSRARKPRAEKPAAEKAAVAAAEAKPAASNSQAAAAEAPKPVAEPAPAPVPAPEKKLEAAAAEEGPKDAPKEASKEAPKPRKRAPRKKAEPKADKTVEAAEPKAAAPEAAEEKPKAAPKKRKTPAKAADKESTEAETAPKKPRARKAAAKPKTAETEGAEGEKPAPKKRAPRKKAAPAAQKEEPAKTE